MVDKYCPRCQFRMSLVDQQLQYECMLCHFFYDEIKELCIFHVGPYKVTQYHLPEEANTVRCIISKDLSTKQLFQELPMDVTQQQLDKIWNQP